MFDVSNLSYDQFLKRKQSEPPCRPHIINVTLKWIWYFHIRDIRNVNVDSGVKWQNDFMNVNQKFAANETNEKNNMQPSIIQTLKRRFCDYKISTDLKCAFRSLTND